MNSELLGNFLPTEILKYFELVRIEEVKDGSTKHDRLNIYLDEKNVIPKEYDGKEYESKGFNNVTMIQDFPIRGKAVYLGIRTRRWRHKVEKSKEIKSDYSFISEGSKMTKELSDFLKGTGR